MTFAFGPNTQTVGLRIVITPDGSGGLNISSQDGTGAPGYLQPPTDVTAAQLANPEIQDLLTRVISAQDVVTNWTNLLAVIGGDTREKWDNTF